LQRVSPIQDGQFAASIEKRGVLIDGTESKPADVYTPLWNYGKAIAIDICGAYVEEPLSNAVNRKQKELQAFSEMQ
jgi:hypothetical protein